MKNLALLLCTMTACLNAPETSTDEQALCRQNPDTCPGNPLTLQQRTNAEVDAVAAHYGYTVTNRNLAGCDSTSCTVNWWIGGGDYLSTTCDNSGCETQHCYQVEPGNWRCDTLPPLG